MLCFRVNILLNSIVLRGRQDRWWQGSLSCYARIFGSIYLSGLLKSALGCVDYWQCWSHFILWGAFRALVIIFDLHSRALVLCLWLDKRQFKVTLSASMTGLVVSPVIESNVRWFSFSVAPSAQRNARLVQALPLPGSIRARSWLCRFRVSTFWNFLPLLLSLLHINSLGCFPGSSSTSPRFPRSSLSAEFEIYDICGLCFNVDRIFSCSGIHVV